MGKHRLWALILTLGAAAAAAEQDPAERAALGRAKVLRIVGRSSGIVGMSSGVAGLLRDLGARVTGQEIAIALAADVLFDFDQAELRADARPSLDKVAAVLRSYPQGPVRIDGHTDSVGAEAYNQALSEKRAAAVKAWLVAAGIAADRLSTRGLGESRPVAANTAADGSDDPAGRQKNRRVEITLRKP
jgi:outer membrane protein OmpA-like peptidoglycan-associated protein